MSSDRRRIVSAFVLIVACTFAVGGGLVWLSGLHHRNLQKLSTTTPFVEHFVLRTTDRYPLKQVRVIDGDTVEADILLPLGVTIRSTVIRCSDYDAWEASRRRRTVEISDEELRKGGMAKNLMTRLAEENLLLAQLESDRDTYGRVLAVLWVCDASGDMRRVRDIMDEAGMIRQVTPPPPEFNPIIR